MHLVIISTTIHGEAGYLKYDRLAAASPFSRVRFIIAADLKSPPFDVGKFQNDMHYLSIAEQGEYASSEPMGWNKIARRNIALLRAMESRPDYILTIDDDNIPPADYFDRWHRVLTKPAERIALPVGPADHHWHNYLRTGDAGIEMYPRGFPIPFRGRLTTAVQTAGVPIAPEEIGVFQGISLGDPDIDAQTRIVYPKPMPLRGIGEANYVLRDVWSPYNTQNTVYAKKLFPLAFTWPHCGRHEDIYASFVWQRFLFNNGMYAHVGDAVNVQDRGTRNLLRDLEQEVEGYLYGHEVWEEISRITEKEPLAFIERLCECRHPIIRRQQEFMRAFRKDFEAVLPS